MEIDIGKEYLIGKTDGWNWNGEKRWWEISVIIDGYNGSGGFWLRERWRWNNDLQIMCENIKTLSIEESENIINKIKENT